jgi:ATP-dependent Lon protease
MTAAKPRPPPAPGETRTYPVLPLRDTVVFPHVIAPLFVGRKKSILALEEVMRSDTFILLATRSISFATMTEHLAPRSVARMSGGR